MERRARARRSRTKAPESTRPADKALGPVVYGTTVSQFSPNVLSMTWEADGDIVARAVNSCRIG
jgi:hypothetical protein